MSGTTFNLTDKRVEVLRWLATRAAPVHVCGIANECLPRLLSDGTPGARYWPQQATRLGAGYARALAEAGLVRVRMADVGWGLAELTEEGRRVLAAFDRNDGSLAEEIERARPTPLTARNYYWWTRRGPRT